MSKPRMTPLGKLSGSATEAKRRAAADKAERRAATTILHPDEVQGDYDAARLLTTTLRGERRPITVDDLIAFRKHIKNFQNRLKGGIRARQVIDLSLPIDRERAREQIRMAVPTAAANGTVRFITNAGPDSRVSRHHVVVQFLGYGAAAAAGRAAPRQMAAWLRKEPLRFDCDCGRHRFWYRYISTIGGYNAGRAETGYPKIRNPRLFGVACKHVLRVMGEIESSTGFLAFLTRLLEKARSNDEAKASVRHTQAAAERLAANQMKRAKAVKTTEERVQERAAAREKRALAAATQTAPPPKRKTAATRRVSSTYEAAALLAAQHRMTPEAVLALLAAQRKG